MAELNFDASQVVPSEGAMGAVAAGWYNVMIDESEIKPTRDGLGAYLNLRFTIVDGAMANRKIFDRLNIRNANPVAQTIAYENLSAIGHAVGVIQMQNSEQLHNIPLKVRVKVRKGNAEFPDDQNEISAYKNINEQVGTTATAIAQPTAPGIPAAMPVAQPALPVAAQPVPVAAVAPVPVAAPVAQPIPAVAQPVAQTAVPTAAQPWDQPAAPVAVQPVAAQPVPAAVPVAAPVAAAPVAQPVAQPAAVVQPAAAPPWQQPTA